MPAAETDPAAEPTDLVEHASERASSLSDAPVTDGAIERDDAYTDGGFAGSLARPDATPIGYSLSSASRLPSVDRIADRSPPMRTIW